jgi:hypothetical protein
MKSNPTRSFKIWSWSSIAFLAALIGNSATALADQVQMRNGDRYVGNVVSLDAKNLVLQSEVLGIINLSRAQVSVITFGAVAPGNSATSPAAANTNGSLRLKSRAATNGDPDLSAVMQELGTNRSALQQVQAQFLTGAGPQANSKFNELMAGLQNGTVSMSDLRAQAKSAAEQIRSMKRELGEDSGLALDCYLAILDSFLKDTAPASPAPKAKPPILVPKTEAEHEHEE